MSPEGKESLFVINFDMGQPHSDPSVHDVDALAELVGDVLKKKLELQQ